MAGGVRVGLVGLQSMHVRVVKVADALYDS
jgi:hypothetical protein